MINKKTKKKRKKDILKLKTYLKQNGRTKTNRQNRTDR